MGLNDGGLGVAFTLSDAFWERKGNSHNTKYKYPAARLDVQSSLT